MNVTNKLFKQSSHYLIGQIGIVLGGFISFPILTRVFSTHEYGILSLVSITVFIFTAIAKLGMQYSGIRFYEEFKLGKRNQHITVFYTTLFIGSLLLSLGMAALVIMIKELIPNNIINPELMRLTWLIAGLIFCKSMFVRVKNFIRAEQKTKIFNIISIVNRYLELGLGLIFIFFFISGVMGYYSGVVLAELLILAVLTGNLIKGGKINLKCFSLPFFKECVQYGYPLVGRELAEFIVKFTDRYLLQAFLGAATVGLYSVGADISHYIQNLIFFPIHYAIFPIYMELWSKKGEQKTREFISKVVNHLLFITIPIILGICALRKEFVVFLASSKFEEASIVIPYIIIGTIMWGFSPLFNAGLYIHKKTKISTLLVFLAGGVNIVLNMLLIPIWGMRGAALASMISYIVSFGLIMKISFRYLKIDIDVVSVLKYVIASLLMYVVIQYLSIGEGFLALLVRFTVGIVTYALIISIIDKELMKSTIAFIKQTYTIR